MGWKCGKQRGYRRVALRLRSGQALRLRSGRASGERKNKAREAQAFLGEVMALESVANGESAGEEVCFVDLGLG